MKMVKSLLLGSAAGVVAIAGAQAADLPVKAKPVQYVKICSLYGAGFYYIPGTDFCLKLGGWVRAEYNANAGGSFNPTAVIYSDNDRDSNNSTWRGRAIVTLDTRNQTEYGTLRTYIAMGFTRTNAGTAPYMPRAFIQWAGFTAGITVSFFDFLQFSALSNQTNFIGHDTGGGGEQVFAYTAQFGNGLSASLSIEEPTNNRTFIGDTGAGGNSYIGANGWPDVVGNLHWTGPWGSAQVMGAVHQVAADYYSNGQVGGVSVWNGHPSDEVGWAVGAGMRWNWPWLGNKDWFGIQGVYAKGALRYVGRGLGGFQTWGDGGDYGIFWGADAVYDSGVVTGSNGDLNLTEGWNIMGGLTHHWDARWQSTLYGGYMKVSPGTGPLAVQFSNALSNTGLSADFDFWQIGSRTKWTPTRGLDFSVDVMYNHLDTAFAGATTTCQTVQGAGGGCTQTVADQDSVQAIFRVQRNFYP